MLTKRSGQVRSGQVRSGQVRSECLTAHSEQAVVVHTCHGHMYHPLPVPLSGTGKQKLGGGSKRGGGGGDRLHWRVQSNQGW